MKTQYTAANLRALTETQLAETLKEESSETGSRFLGIGKIVGILAEHKPQGVTLGKFIASKVPGLDAKTLGHGYKAAAVWSAMVDLPDTTRDAAPIGSGLITEADYDLCAISWLITVCAVLNYMEKEKKPVEYVLEVCERMAVLLRAREATTQAALEIVKASVVPKAAKADAAPGDASEAEKKLAEEIAAKDKQLEDGKAEFEKWKAEAEENGRKMRARITELESLTGKLSELAGTFITLANEEQAAMVLPLIHALPETLKSQLTDLFALRLESLESQFAKAA